CLIFVFFFSSRRRHTRSYGDWSSDVCSSDLSLPPGGDWFVRVIASKNRFVLGMYRRHMKTIGYLGQIDKLFGAPVTTRNWNTIRSEERRVGKEWRSRGGAGH